MDREAVKRRLVELRRALGYDKPTRFAKFLGIATNTLGNWESPGNGRVPGYDHITHISRVTGYSLDWLLRGEEGTLQLRHVEALQRAREALAAEAASPPKARKRGRKPRGSAGQSAPPVSKRRH